MAILENILSSSQDRRKIYAFYLGIHRWFPSGQFCSSMIQLMATYNYSMSAKKINSRSIRLLIPHCVTLYVPVNDNRRPSKAAETLYTVTPLLKYQIIT